MEESHYSGGLILFIYIPARVHVRLLASLAMLVVADLLTDQNCPSLKAHDSSRL